MATKASRAALAAASKIDASGNIDADTLDTIDSLQFTRSDQADSLTELLTIDPSTNGITAFKIGAGTDSSEYYSAYLQASDDGVSTGFDIQRRTQIGSSNSHRLTGKGIVSMNQNWQMYRYYNSAYTQVAEMDHTDGDFYFVNNVGIGAASPNLKLDVATSSGAGGQFNRHILVSRGTSVGGSIGTIRAASTNDVSEMVLGVGTDQTLYITDSSYVGVAINPATLSYGTPGTLDLDEVDSTAVASKFWVGHPTSNGTSEIRIMTYGSSDDAGGGGLYFTNTRFGSAASNSDLGAIVSKRESYGKGYLRFFTNPGGGNTEKMRITGDGNVGIGTQTPSAKLDVAGGAKVNGTLDIVTVNDYKIRLYSPSGDSSDWNYIDFYGRDGTRDGYIGTDQSGNMRFYSDKNSNYIANDSNGYYVNTNFGVGTSPTTTLDVNGSSHLGSRSNGGNDIVTELSGMGVDSSGTRYGSYGQLRFHATSSYTGSARRWLITNAYQANKLAFITTDYNSDPVITSGGGTNGTVALTMDGSANLNVQQSIGIRRDVPRVPVDIGSITSAMIIPVGSNAQQPSTTYAGMMRFNSDTGMGELHDGNNWNTFGGYVSPYYYATATAAAADSLYAYFSASSTSATSSQAGTSSATASLSGVSANAAYAGNGWDRGTSYSNYIQLNGMISGTAPTLTVAWWFVMTDSTIHSTTDGAGMFWPNANGSYPSQVMIGYDGSPRVLRAGGTGWVSDGSVVINPLNTGAYHHVVCVINGSSCAYYINGQAAHTETASYVFGSSWMFSNYSQIGGNTNNHYHRGKIDEIAVWSRALSGTEVSNLYDAYANGYSLVETIGVV